MVSKPWISDKQGSVSVSKPWISDKQGFAPLQFLYKSIYEI